MDEFKDSIIVFGADLSLNRPGFCRIKVSKDGEKYAIKAVTVMSIDNKTKKKTRGQKLEEISEGFYDFIKNDINENCYFVREAVVNNGSHSPLNAASTRTGLSEVVGVMDLVLWQKAKKEWEEFYPATIKKEISGNGRADKQAVASAVLEYIRGIEFINDDESDAAAVALTWLTKNGYIDHKIKENEDEKDEHSSKVRKGK